MQRCAPVEVWIADRVTGKTVVRELAVTAAHFARLGLAFALTRSLRLRADVLAGVVIQGVSIHVVQREAAIWGRPLVLSSVGVDFGWL